MRRQLGDDIVDRLASLDHNDDGPRFYQRRHKIGDALGRHDATITAMFADELISAFAMAIIYRYAKSLPRGIARKICAHGGQP
jgi:hypothetical protein